MRRFATLLAVVAALSIAGSPATADTEKRERIRDALNDLVDAQPSLAPEPGRGVAGQAGYAMDGMLFGAASYWSGEAGAGIVAEHFDGDLLGGVWGGATVFERGYIELRGLGGLNSLGLAEFRAEWSIPVAANAAVTPFAVGTYAEEERVEFTRAEAGASVGVATELLERPVSFRAGLGGIDANAYDLRLRASAGAVVPLGPFRLGIGGRYTTGVEELGVGAAVRVVF